MSLSLVDVLSRLVLAVSGCAQYLLSKSFSDIEFVLSLGECFSLSVLVVRPCLSPSRFFFSCRRSGRRAYFDSGIWL
jgi:hypothetical protein